MKKVFPIEGQQPKKTCRQRADAMLARDAGIVNLPEEERRARWHVTLTSDDEGSPNQVTQRAQ